MDQQYKEPPFTVQNGRRVYQVSLTVNGEMRSTSPGRPARTMNADPDTGTIVEAGTETAPQAPAEGTQEDGDTVRVLCRLLSAVDTWSWHSWYGRQLVGNGHDNARALRQVVGLVNDAKRPIPLMWDHSDQMRDKAGRVENAAWEDSTDIPPGVNADLVVSRKYDAKAAVGLETRVIDATSIDWFFEAELSHPDMEFRQFIDLQGHEIDGKIVKWLPVKAVVVHHHAMVPAGADPDSGPRQTDPASKNAAQPLRNSKQGGDNMSAQVLMTMVTAMCKTLGIDVMLSDGAAIPDGLEERIVTRVQQALTAQASYNDLAQKLQNLQSFVVKQGESALSAATILERLPERLELAIHGEAFIAHERKEAVAWFDKAKADPERESLSDLDKRQRERIANSSDLGFLADCIAEYRATATKRFGSVESLRTSTGEEDLPNPSRQEITAQQRAIEAQVQRSGWGRKESAVGGDK